VILSRAVDGSYLTAKGRTSRMISNRSLAPTKRKVAIVLEASPTNGAAFADETVESGLVSALINNVFFLSTRRRRRGVFMSLVSWHRGAVALLLTVTTAGDILDVHIVALLVRPFAKSAFAIAVDLHALVLIAQRANLVRVAAIAHRSNWAASHKWRTEVGAGWVAVVDCSAVSPASTAHTSIGGVINLQTDPIEIVLLGNLAAAALRLRRKFLGLSMLTALDQGSDEVLLSLAVDGSQLATICLTEIFSSRLVEVLGAFRRGSVDSVASILKDLLPHWTIQCLKGGGNANYHEQ